MVVPAGSGAPRFLGSASEAFVAALVALGVEQAFGVFGGGIAPFCSALSQSPIRLMHCRSEAGASFAAIESSLASGRLTVVVATTGPGLTSLVTGMAAARSEGAHVLFVSGATTPAQRGRGAFQETSYHAAGLGALLQPGSLLHCAQMLEDPAELAPLCARLANGLHQPGGFVAHVGFPLSVQTAPGQDVAIRVSHAGSPKPDPMAITRCRELLRPGRFVIWAGFGARHAAAEVRRLAEAARAPVMCSPRGKGVMPESHPLFLGVTGLGGHARVSDYFADTAVDRVLVLGSRLSEMTSFWSQRLAPAGGFVHVDVDTSAFGAAYPNVRTFGVQSDVAEFARELSHQYADEAPLTPKVMRRASFKPLPKVGPLVRYSALMSSVQRKVVEHSSAVVLTEAGNSFMLGNHYLSFDAPHRYRVSTQFGSMGQAAAGVLGAACARGKAVALVGDGALLMFNELSTAAKYGIPAVWVVLNDARYGMVEDGMRSIGWTPFETDFPRTDFVAIAEAMGVRGTRVTDEHQLDKALGEALEADGPFLVDVWIDLSEQAPTNRRNDSLQRQGVNPEAAE
jgi:acetolactate synthase-1/2/3 large subunit